jgi:hypothetical protein
MSMRSIFLLLATLLAACGGKSGADYHTRARAALDGGKPAEAVTLAEEGLARDDVRRDAAAAWRLEQVRLEALAKSGRGTQVKTDLERLAQAYPKQVTASLYRALADKAKEAGDTSGAIDVLSAGDQRFPGEHASFVEAINALKASGSLDPAEVQRLKALGYL